MFEVILPKQLSSYRGVNLESFFEFHFWHCLRYLLFPPSFCVNCGDSENFRRVMESVVTLRAIRKQ